MSYWRGRSQTPTRGGPDPWNDNSFRSSSYGQDLDEPLWQSDRMNLSSRNGPPSLFSQRPGSQLSSSNQVNSNLFSSYQSRGGIDRGNDDFGLRGDRFRAPSSSLYNPGRITRNSLVEASRARRILQKRALNAVGANTSAAPPVRRRRPRPRKPAVTTSTPEKNATTTEKEKKRILPKAEPEWRLAVLWENDDKAVLTGEYASLLVKRVEEILDARPPGEDGHIPKFYTGGFTNGVYKVVGVDQKSADWFKETVENITDLWENCKLKVIQQSELNALKYVTLLNAKNDITLVQLFNRIEKQNPELKTDQWRLQREIWENSKRSIILAIDDVSLEYLTKHEWKLFVGLRQVKFTPGTSKPTPPPLK